MTLEYKKDDCVKVNAGVMNFHLPHHALEGYQGRVYQVKETADDSIVITVAWDSHTLLKQMPDNVIKTCMEKDLPWIVGRLSPEDISPAEARDTDDDVDNAIDALYKRHDEFFSSDIYLAMESDIFNKNGKPSLNFREAVMEAGYDNEDRNFHRLLRYQQYKLIDLFVKASEIQQTLADLSADLSYDERFVKFWVENLLEKLYSFQSVSTYNASVTDISVLLNEVFPEKITLTDPKEATYIIPILRAFWVFLKREYADELTEVDDIIAYLDDVAPHYPTIMNDESRFGYAKQFIMAIKNYGMDTASSDTISQFIGEHADELSFNSPREPSYAHPTELYDYIGSENSDKPTVPKISAEKRKQKRQQAKASRKANRKRKK